MATACLGRRSVETSRKKLDDREMPDLTGYFCVAANNRAKERQSLGNRRFPVRQVPFFFRVRSGACIRSPSRGMAEAGPRRLLRFLRNIPDALLKHASPLIWQHINLTGIYAWDTADQTPSTPMAENSHDSNEAL